jgi:predicted transcriptional regulator
MPKVIIADNAGLPLAELFGGRLKQRRLAHNMTQAQLAERTGSTAAYISQVERAQANPTLISWRRLPKFSTPMCGICFVRTTTRNLIIRN